MSKKHKIESLCKVQETVRELQEKEKQATRELVLSGKKIIELNLVHNLQDKDHQTQPAGIDFTLKKLATFESSGIIDFYNIKRSLPEYREIVFEKDIIHLQLGAYLVEFNEIVTLPTYIIGIMRTRSSLFRSGATLTAGVIDPGYSGAVGALLQVWNENGISLSRNAKLVQWFFAQIDDPSEEGYKGIYKDARNVF